MLIRLFFLDTACVRDGYTDKWHYFDDSKFSLCDENKVVVIQKSETKIISFIQVLFYFFLDKSGLQLILC